MDINEYIDFVNKKIAEAIAKGDYAEVTRLTTVLRDTLNDKIREWESYEAEKYGNSAHDFHHEL